MERDGRTGWLVGSLHLLTADAYPLPPALDAAFARADVLVEEANPEELKAPAAAMQLLAKAMYPPGTTLQSQVSKDTFEKIAQARRAAGLPIERLQQFKPWMVALTLVGLELQRGGFDASLGLDQHFLQPRAGGGQDRAHARDARSSRSTSSRASARSCRTGWWRRRSTAPRPSWRRCRRLPPPGRRGDPAPIERLLLSDMKGVDAKVYDTLLVGRNRRWLPKLEECFAAQRCFVVVGAAHLVGPDGLVTMLRAKGYTVTQQ